MDIMPLQAVLFISVPEEMMLTALGLQLMGLKFRFREIFLIGVVGALLAYLVRRLPLIFWSHTVILVFLYSLVIVLVKGIPYRKALGAMVMSTTVLVMLELIYMLILRTRYGDVAVWLADGWQRVYFWLPEGIFLLVLVLVVYLFDFQMLSYGRSEPSPWERLQVKWSEYLKDHCRPPKAK